MTQDTFDTTRKFVRVVVFRRRLHVNLEVGCTNNAACEDALHRLQREQLSHRLPSSNKPGLTIFHQHFGNQRARVVVR